MELNGLVLIEHERLQELIKIAVVDALKEFSNLTQTKPEEVLITRNEAAKLLNVSPNTMTRYVRERKLKAGVSNGVYRFKKSEVMNFMFKGK